MCSHSFPCFLQFTAQVYRLYLGASQCAFIQLFFKMVSLSSSWDCKYAPSRECDLCAFIYQKKFIFFKHYRFLCSFGTLSFSFIKVYIQTYSLFSGLPVTKRSKVISKYMAPGLIVVSAVHVNKFSWPNLINRPIKFDYNM